jgi:ATP-dependent Zn protease
MQLATFLRSRSMSGAVALLLVTIAGACSGSTVEGPQMPYSDLVLRAAQGEVESIFQEGTTLSVTLSGEALPQTVVVNEQLNVREELCAAAGADEAGECRIRYEFAEPSAAGGLLALLVTALLPVLLIGGFIFFMMRRAAPRPRR